MQITGDPVGTLGRIYIGKVSIGKKLPNKQKRSIENLPSKRANKSIDKDVDAKEEWLRVMKNKTENARW